MKLSKASLAVELSKLETLKEGQIKLEQYHTDSEVAATILWNAFLLGDIEKKTVADLGAGTGILGIGASLLGANMVFLVEKDPNAIEIAERNIKKNVEVIFSDVRNFTKQVDTVVMNPPFGTKDIHADRKFLKQAFKIAKVIYSIHKSSTMQFVEAMSRDHELTITHVWDFKLRLKRSYDFHSKPRVEVEVSCFRFAKAF